MLPVWEFRGACCKENPPFSSDQQEEGPRGSAACRGMLPSNLGDFTANSLNPEFLSSNLGREKQSPGLISILSPISSFLFASGF